MSYDYGLMKLNKIIDMLSTLTWAWKTVEYA